MSKEENRRGRILQGLLLIIVPPVTALVLAAVSVDVTKHDRGNAPTPAPWYDVLFPLALIATFVCLPIGVYLIYKAFARSA